MILTIVATASERHAPPSHANKQLTRVSSHFILMQDEISLQSESLKKVIISGHRIFGVI